MESKTNRAEKISESADKFGQLVRNAIQAFCDLGALLQKLPARGRSQKLVQSIANLTGELETLRRSTKLLTEMVTAESKAVMNLLGLTASEQTVYLRRHIGGQNFNQIGREMKMPRDEVKVLYDSAAAKLSRGQHL